MPNAALVNFAAGETSPSSRGRFDAPWYGASCQKLQNFIPEVAGPARFRPGLKFTRETRAGGVARLIPFQLSASRGYMLEFTPGKMRIYKDGDLLTKTPYGLLTATDLLDNFTDGDYTSSPAWTPYVAARVAVTSNRLVTTAADVAGTVYGGGARTAQTRNIGKFEFDATVAADGHVAFFAKTWTPVAHASGLPTPAFTLTEGYCLYRASGGNYKFGRLSAAGTITQILDTGAVHAALSTYAFVRDSVGNWTVTVTTAGTVVYTGAALDNTYTETNFFAQCATTTDATSTTTDNIRIPSAGATDNQGVITGITAANPAVVTVSAVGDLANGDECIVEDVLGMFEMNGRQVKLAGSAGSTFQLLDPTTGANINSTAFGAWTSGGRLKEIYEIDTPYYAGDLDDLTWAVSARDGVMYIDHPKYDERKLTVDSADNFTLTTFARTNDPFVNRSATLTIAGIDRAASGTLIYFTPGSVIDPNATYTFAGISGTTQLNAGTYRLRVPSGSFSTPRGYLVTTTGEAEVDSSAWSAWTSGGTATPDVEHPIAVAFYEGRKFNIGTSVRVNVLLGSAAPDDDGNPRYDDFTAGTDDDDAVAFALAPTNGQIDTVAWARGTSKYLFVGTFGGPFRVSGAGLDEPITPTSVNVRQFDDFGCEATMPVSASRVFWIQRGGVSLRSSRFDADADDLTSYDMMLNAEHIAASRLRRVVLQAGRPDVLWVVREDGILAGMTVQGDENIAGWHRQKIGGTAAKVLDAQVLARTDRDDQLWVVTERTVNGATRRFVETLVDAVPFLDREDFYARGANEAADRTLFENSVYRRQEEYVHMDAAGTYDGSERGADALATLTLSAATVGAGRTATASAAVFRSTDMGREIWVKPDRDTGVGGGRATITAYTDTTHVTVEVTVEFSSVGAHAAGEWYFTATTIYGLWHLEGQTVAVLVDGAVYSNGRTPLVGTAVTVASGKITLTEAAAVVHVGLAYDGILKTQNLEAGGRTGPAQAKPRNIFEFALRFLNTLGIQYGTDLYKLETIQHRRNNAIADRPAPVFSGIRKLPYPDRWRGTDNEAEEKHIVITQLLPLPGTVQFIDARYEAADE